MNKAAMVELAGYLGSVLVVVSMLMSSVVKLRIINTIGSCISAAYALIIHSYPLALMNICLIIINCYNLAKLLRSQQQYDLIQVNTDDAFLSYFTGSYKEDILKYFPGSSLDASGCDTAYIVCCNAAPAGLLLGNMSENGVLDITADYTTPAYRDCSVGKYLYSKLPEQGIRKLIYAGSCERHKDYLLKMGFVYTHGVYEKTLV